MPPRPRFTKLDDEKQMSILEAAALEFAAHGFEGASLNQIIEKAGISKGAAYYYFDDKKDVYDTVIDFAMDKLARAIGGFALEDFTAEGFWEELYEYTRRALVYISEHTWVLAMIGQYHAKVSPDGTASQRTLYQFGWRWTKAFVERGQTLGQIRGDLPLELLVDAAMALGSAADRYLITNWEKWSMEERDQACRDYLDLMRRMLEVQDRAEENL